MPWKLLCLPFELGELGVTRVSEFNVSLLCKWFWRVKDRNLWVRVIQKKYGLAKDNLFPKSSSGAVGCNIWNGLSKVFKLFKILTCFKAVMNTNLRFLYDSWCSSKPLHVPFPRVLEEYTNKRRHVSEFAQLNEDVQVSWKLFVPWRLNDFAINKLP